MSSISLYSKIYDYNISYLKSGDIITDDNIDNLEQDTRLGISLIIPIKSINLNYDKLIKTFSKIDQDQYYYPFMDLHITIFDFIKGSSLYVRNKMLEEQFIKVCDALFKNVYCFNINFSGVVFSKEAGLIKGYDLGTLINIRNSIRNEMNKNNLTLDERYKSESAHITFCRFRNKIKNLKHFINLIEEHKEYNLGKQVVDSIELVEHDWYNLKSKKRLIKTYNLEEVNNYV